MTNYQKRLSATKEQKSAAEQAAAVESAQIDIETFIGSKRKQVNTVKNAIEAELGSTSFNVERIIALSQEQKKYEDAIATARGILDTEFTDETAAA